MGAFFSEHTVPAGLRSVIERSKISLSLADFSAPDCPLIGVNERFCALTGYGHAEVIGRNCRFLQPAGIESPVRARMRDYLSDPAQSDGRFLIPNITRTGRRFLNLVYLTKLSRDGTIEYVLGSQFSVSVDNPREANVYDRALVEDLRILKDVLGESTLMLLGSFEALASSHSIIAQSRLEGSKGNE